MNIIDFTKNGGYRLKQFTFRKMQEAYVQILKMFVAFCNIPEVGNYIIQGCTIAGADITSGYLYIDGELCYFEQSAGDTTTKIKKNVVIQSLGFKNGNSENVFRFTNAITHATEGVELSTFTRVFPVFDANYVHTDNNFTTAEQTKLAGIEAGAEVNVKADWNVVNPASDAFILNKPIIPNVLHMGSTVLGDFPVGTLAHPNDELRTINFPDVGTTDYSVFPVLVSNGGFDQDNDVMIQVKNKTTSSFDLSGREMNNLTQSLTLDYMVIKNQT